MSVEMIEKYYAAHIKTSLDSVAINVMRKKRNKVEEYNVESPTQAQTGNEETDV
jgi:hypothetical protein